LHRAGELSRDIPIVTICRSGARSAQAVVLLQKAGFRQAANLSGGMLRWTAEHHPVESTAARDPRAERASPAR
jgi:rhodanese-related sulfurtransferase